MKFKTEKFVTCKTSDDQTKLIGTNFIHSKWEANFRSFNFNKETSTKWKYG